jgi:hypothetical protein
MTDALSDTVIQPSVGILWGIKEASAPILLIADRTPLCDAELYGDCLTNPRGHYEVWESWRRLGPAGLRRRWLPALIAWHEYEHFPRGRVVFETGTGNFVLYADRKLQTEDVLPRLLRIFGLCTTQCQVRSDPHYRTSTL